MSDIAPPPHKTYGLIGHAAAESELRAAWQSGRMPHAWLIGGPQGVGKATLAYRFARSVLAAEGDLAAEGEGGLFGAAEPLWDVPPEHPVFRWIAAEAHPDLFVLRRTEDAKTGKLRDGIIVDDARRLLSFFAHTPAEGGWRVAIVDAADELNVYAANALLKIIEEPPDRGLVLIVAHRPGMVLPTIRSRCRVLRTGRLEDAEVAEVLARHWPELPGETAAGLVAMAEGSPGRALALGEADGFGVYADLVALLTGLPDLDVAAMHKFADRLSRRDVGGAFRTLADLPGWWLSRMIRWGAGHPPAAEAVPGEAVAYPRLLPRRSLEQWAAVWEKLSLLAARGAARNLDHKQIALNLLTTLGQAARG